MKSYCNMLFQRASGGLKNRAKNSLLSFVFGVGWTALGEIFSRGVILVGTLMLARIWEIDTYGKFGLIRLTLQSVVGVAGLGIGVALTRHIARLRVSEPNRALGVLALGVVVTLASGALFGGGIVFFEREIAGTWLHNENLKSLVIYLGLMVLALVLQGTLSGALAGFAAFRAIALTQGLAAIIGVPIMTILACRHGLEGGVTGLAVLYALQTIMSGIAVYLLVRRNLNRPVIRVIFPDLVMVVQTALPAFLSSMMISPIMFFAQCLVASGSNGYRELAFFNIAVPWAMFVMILPGLVGRPLLPMLAMAEMTPTHQLKIVRAAGGLMLAAAVMVAVPISAASPWIMGLYGNGYRTAWPVLVILTGGYAITWVAGVTDYIITARGNVWLSVSLNAVWGLVVVLCASFWKHDGALGLAWAVFAAFSTKAVFQLLYLYKFFLNANAFQATLDRAVNKQKLLKC